MMRVGLHSSLKGAAAGLAIFLLATPASAAQTPAAPPQSAPQASAAGNGSASKGLPMWVIRDADSTVYVTGTVHLLPDGVDWRSERLEAALGSAGELYLELAEIADPNWLATKVMPVVEEYARWDGPPLSTLLTEDERARLADALKKANASAEVIAKTETMQPWYTSYALGREQFMDAYKRENGIDEALARIAVSSGKPVKGMENIRDQIELMVGPPPDEQIEQLKALLRVPDSLKQASARLANIAYGGWARGEINAVEGLAIMFANGPDSDALLLNRNEHWAGKIEDILKGSGVTFIAVGAVHLVGPNSLQSRLKLRGIKAERYG